MHNFNETAKIKENQLEAISKLIDFLEFQSATKQLSFLFSCFNLSKIALIDFPYHIRLVQNFSDIYQPIIMILFIWTIGERFDYFYIHAPTLNLL